MVLEMEIVEQRWHTLAEMVTDLLERGIHISSESMATFMMCRTLINHYKIHRINPQPCCKNSRNDILDRIQLELASAETLLYREAARIGEVYSEEWLTKIITLWETRSKPFLKVVALGEEMEPSDQETKPDIHPKPRV